MVSLGRVVAPAPVNLPSVRYAALVLQLILRSNLYLVCMHSISCAVQIGEPWQ
jgi:hypothetical protein